MPTPCGINDGWRSDGEGSTPRAGISGHRHTLGNAKNLDRPLVPLDAHCAERCRLLARALEHLVRSEDLRVVLLVELLDARGEDDDIAGHRVLFALGRANVAGDGIAGMKADADLHLYPGDELPRRRECVLAVV